MGRGSFHISNNELFILKFQNGHGVKQVNGSFVRNDNNNGTVKSNLSSSSVCSFDSNALTTKTQLELH